MREDSFQFGAYESDVAGFLDDTDSRHWTDDGLHQLIVGELTLDPLEILFGEQDQGLQCGDPVRGAFQSISTSGS